MKITPFNIIAALGCATAMLSGCANLSLKPVSYEVLQPAPITLPQWADTVIIVNSTPWAAVNDETIQADHAPSQKLLAEGKRQMPGYVCRGLSESLNQSGYIVGRYVDEYHPFTQARIDSFLAGRHATVLLSLSAADGSSAIEVAQHDFVQLSCASHIRIDIVSGRQDALTIINRRDTLKFTSVGEDFNEIVAGLPRILDKYKEMGLNAGAKAAEQLLPVWSRQHRTVYVTSTGALAAANEWVDKNNWDEARNLWIDTYQKSGKSADRVRAALNTALSYEREDNAMEASMWCSKALDILDKLQGKELDALKEEKTRAEMMFAYLMERMDQKDVLDKQM